MGTSALFVAAVLVTGPSSLATPPPLGTQQDDDYRQSRTAATDLYP